MRCKPLKTKKEHEDATRSIEDFKKAVKDKHEKKGKPNDGEAEKEAEKERLKTQKKFGDDYAPEEKECLYPKEDY